MLVVTPSALFGRVGAVLSALLVVFSLIGLTVHSDFYAGRRRRGYFLYFTNVSNLLVLLYFALVAPRLYARAALRPLIAHVEFALTMSIMLTFAVFHHLLLPGVLKGLRGAPHTRELAIMAADNAAEHYIVPWLTFAYWVLCAPYKNTLTLADAALWTAVPLVYLLFALLCARRGENLPGTDSPYPYPFLDVSRRGAAAVARTCMRLLALCVGSGALAVTIIRAAFAVFGSGHALILI